MDDRGLFLWALLACGAHEVAHMVVLLAVGGSVKEFNLTAFGAQLQGQKGSRLSYGGELMAVLAGPGLNLLLAVVSAHGGERWYLFAGLNVALGVFNLLPVPGLDGGRAFGILAAMLADEEKKRRKE